MAIFLDKFEFPHKWSVCQEMSFLNSFGCIGVLQLLVGIFSAREGSKETLVSRTPMGS